MFILEPGYTEQLARWGLDELVGAMAFPAQVGPPPADPRWQRVAEGSTTSCYRLSPAPGEAHDHYRPLFLKHYRYRPPTWRYVLRPSRARREADNLRLLSRLGIHCPRVVALGERRQQLELSRRIWWPIRPLAECLLALTAAGPLRLANRDLLAGAVLIVTAIEPSEDLDQFSRAHWQQPYRGDPVQRRQIDSLARQLAAQVAVVHDRGFVHRDLKFRNLLACWPRGQQPTADNLRLAWIDCPRGRHLPPGPVRRHWIINDLSNLARNSEPFTSRTQRLRFLRDYLMTLGGEPAVEELRDYVRRIAGYRRRREHKLARRQARRRLASGGRESESSAG